MSRQVSNLLFENRGGSADHAWVEVRAPVGLVYSVVGQHAEQVWPRAFDPFQQSQKSGESRAAGGGQGQMSDQLIHFHISLPRSGAELPFKVVHR